jgi:cytochrome c-type biogenesis protein CcmH
MIKSSKSTFFGLIAILLLLSTVFSLKASPTKLEVNEVVEEVFSELNSPFCKGRLLRDCPSSGAQELKNDVRKLAKEGVTTQEIIDKLYVKYGDEIRAVPKDGVVGIIAWLGPFIFLFIGGSIVLFWITRIRKKQTTQL